MENDMGKGGKKKRGRKDWCNGSFHFCPFVSLFCYFWYVFLQNCDFMGTHFKENTDDDVERNENIGKGSNGVVFKVLTKNRKHRLVVKEVRYLREESGWQLVLVDEVSQIFFLAVREATNFCWFIVMATNSNKCVSLVYLGSKYLKNIYKVYGTKAMATLFWSLTWSIARPTICCAKK